MESTKKWKNVYGDLQTKRTDKTPMFFEKSGRIMNNNPKCPKTVELIEIGRPQAILLHHFDIYYSTVTLLLANI